MNNRWIDLRLKIIQFFRKYKRIIFVSIIIWIIVIAINYIIKNMDFEKIPYTTYEPNKAVMDNSKVPNRLQEPIEKIIDAFITACNKKEYETAFNLIATDCKEMKFKNNIDEFKKYVDTNFEVKKVYNIQDFSNLKDTYIYNVKILEDIMATGMTNSGYAFYEEKFVVRETEEGIKLSLLGYVKTDELNILAQDDNMRIKIKNRVVNYDNEQYEIEITNRTGKYIVLYDGTESNEIEINIGNQKRQMISDNKEGFIAINPMDTATIKLSFTKFVDDGRQTSELIFNSIRILERYSTNVNERLEDVKNAKEKYSLKIDLNQ